MTHTPHADVHTHGLADDCPRCSEHAENPLASLDRQCIQDLLQRLNLDWSPRSETEARAMEALRRTMREGQMLNEVLA
jgi:hypothetical protein